jgi:processive 1,2-diacylglycerol beta-glucosyltransferase
MEKILILSVSAGSGHIRAADALVKAFGQSGCAKEVLHLDYLAYTNALFKRMYGGGYVDMVNHAPWLFGWLYKFWDAPYRLERFRQFIQKMNSAPIFKFIREYEADLIITTHFLSEEMVSCLRGRGEIQSRHAVVVTDYDVHAMWLSRNCDHFFVPLDTTAAQLKSYGVLSENITISGIPIDPDFAVSKDKNEMRNKLGLALDVPVVLFTAGIFGMGPMEKIMNSLFHISHPVQIIVNCGKNEALQNKVNSLIQTTSFNPKISLKVVGFIRQMDEYMAASDMVLGKPGGLTVSEAMSKGLPYVIVTPIPGQEEHNSDHLLEAGVAVRCNHLPTLGFQIDKLLADSQRLARMKSNALAFGKPLAAKTIVEKITELYPLNAPRP